VPGLPSRLVAIVDRLLALNPDNRFGSAIQAAEALEELIPPTGLTDRGTSGKRATIQATGDPSPSVAANAALDWSLIGSAIRSPDLGASTSRRLVDKTEPKPLSSRELTANRKTLEDDGAESGRKAHETYRNQLIQMKQVMAELRAMDPNDETPGADSTWLER